MPQPMVHASARARRRVGRRRLALLVAGLAAAIAVILSQLGGDLPAPPSLDLIARAREGSTIQITVASDASRWRVGSAP